MIKVAHLLFFIFSFSQLSAQSSCFNLDFEQMDTSNWTFSTGIACTASSGCYNQTATGSNFSAPSWDRQHHRGLFNYLDWHVPTIHSLCPFTGSSSMRLGDRNAGVKAEQMQIIVNTDSLSDSLSFYYAYVTDDPGHFLEANPYFSLVIEYLEEDSIPKIDTIIYVNSSDTSLVAYSTLVRYLDWKDHSINLAKYNGNVTIRLTNSDCAFGQHQGRVFFDFSGSRAPISIEKINKKIQIDLYPNPTSSFVNIRTKHIYDRLELFNLEGKRVLTINDDLNQIDLRHLTPSVYFLKITDKEKGVIYSNRIIKL